MGLPQAILILGSAKALVGVVPVVGAQLASLLGAAVKVCEIANVRQLALAAESDR